MFRKLKCFVGLALKLEYNKLRLRWLLEATRFEWALSSTR